jgi:FrmR/RcnR family transcriptional regulator, repressor of frmRAB operon
MLAHVQGKGQEVVLLVSPITANIARKICLLGRGAVLDTTREKTKLVNRVRRIRGQIEAVERALERETGCSDMLRIITSARGAINGLMAEVIEDYVRTRVVDPLREPDTARALAAEEFIDIVHSYLK